MTTTVNEKTAATTALNLLDPKALAAVSRMELVALR